MAYVAYLCTLKSQIPDLTYVEKFSVVRWLKLCKSFLRTGTKSLITWHMSCRIRLIVTERLVKIFKDFSFPS